MTFRKLWRKISNTEWRWLIAVSLLVIVVTSLPAVYGFLKSGPDQTFTGMHFVSADDWFVYYSFINQGAEGKLLFFDLFASVDHLPVLRPLWLVVGWLAFLFRLPAWAALHLARIILIPVFFVLVYLLIVYLFEAERWRKLGLIFLAFSSGLGVTFIHRLVRNPLNASQGQFQWPMDLWVPDINTFFTLYTSPHFIAATILLLVIFLSLLLFVEKPRYFYSLVAGLSGLVLFWFHPFQVVKVFAIIGIFLLILIFKNKKLIWSHLWFGLIFLVLSLPAVGYYLWLFQNDWLTLQRSLQNINPTTPFYLTLISFGGLLAFSIVGIYFLLKNFNKISTAQLFIIVWVVVQFGLLYAPITYQRRLGLGIHVPLVLLTIFGFYYLYQRYSNWLRLRLVGLATIGIFVFLPSTIFVVSADLMVFSQERELSYISSDIVGGLEWLRQNSENSSIIFSETKTGLLIPVYARCITYVSHPVESPLYSLKKDDPIWFFSNNKSLELEKNFLRQRDVDYIFFGPKEQVIGDYDPSTKPYLRSVYQNKTVSVYQVL